MSWSLIINIMVTIRADFKNWDHLYVTLDQFVTKNQAFVSDALFQLGNTLLNLIKERVPVDTGQYINSWRILNQNANTITVGSTADPALFIILEFSGARPHKIEGNPILHFELGGQEVFVTSVNHPGMKPQPHLRPAIEELKKMAKGIIYRTMARHFTLLEREGAKFGETEVRARGTSNIGRSSIDVTPNIGRGTKGRIHAQLTSRKTFRKRIRIKGTRRVGTSIKTRIRP